jgi:Putative transposase/Transposase zinc-binding domain
MITLADVISRFEADYLQQYSATMLPSHRQALAAMKHCRTAMAPRMLAACSACDEKRLVPHSCGHRNCPHCQHFESQQWLERQIRRQVPGNHFLLTFTLPAELRELAWRNQRTLYAVLFECAWATVSTFSRNDRHLQGHPGAVAVLHTHSRRLDYHPHVHLAMPAAALDAKTRRWRTKSRGSQGSGYLFNHRALAKVFRAKVLAALNREGFILPPEVPEKWVVDCKGVGDGEKALVYLGRYLYRGVIQEQDILSCDNAQVRFRYRDGKTGKSAVRTVSGAHFLCLIVQHVLPKGFRRARNFGFLHPNSKRLLALLQVVLKVIPNADLSWMKPRPPFLCSCCGAPMRIVCRRLSAHDHRLRSVSSTEDLAV